MPQEQANREEASTRVIGAKIQNVKATVTLEETEDVAGFTRCIRRNPKQVRNTFDCPGDCQNLYRGLALANKKQLADEKLARLKDLDEAPVMRSSAEKAEEQVLQSFQDNKGSKEVVICKLRSNSWIPIDCIHGWANIPLPKQSVDLLNKVAPLSPKRFARVLEKAIQDKVPDIEIHAIPKFDEHGDAATFHVAGTWKKGGGDYRDTRPIK